MVRRSQPEFEPAFGSREADQPLAPRRRDRREDAEVDPAGEVDDLVGGVESHRTIGDDESPLSASDQAAPDVPHSQFSAGGNVGGGPVIPAEILEAQARTAVAHGQVTPSDGTRPPSRTGTRSFRVRRRVLATFGLVMTLGLVYFSASLAQVWATGRSDDRSPVDAIVVMGAAQYDGRPSPQLAARLDHVLELWPEGVAPLVVVTGGNLPGDRFTEAEASAEYLIDRGVPSDSVVLENSGTNSYESLRAVAQLLGQRALDDVVVVTDPYHALRSRLIADEVGLDAQVSSTETSVVTGFDSFSRHVQEAGGVAIGRVIGFDRLSTLTD